MSRVHNFAAGPALLPDQVLERIRADLPDWHGRGMSVMEINHRGSDFGELAAAAEAKLRRLMGVPDDYAVLFLHGPARLQFSAVPLNLAAGAPVADYLDTGLWSEHAIREARRYVEVNVAASAREGGYVDIPDPAGWRLREDAAYVHYTPNETIGGVEFHDLPRAGDVPLVADMSSNILSRPVDVRRHGLIYAGAQKNVGIAGLALVVVRRDLMQRAGEQVPEMMDYRVHDEGRSLACTAPTFAWYVADLVFDWLLDLGGLEAVAEINRRKAERLYGYIDGSNFYRNPVARAARSRMNVTFTLADAALDEAFLTGAREAGLVGLKGHRFVGGMRASLYNAMPEQAVDRLVEFMRDFAARKA